MKPQIKNLVYSTILAIVLIGSCGRFLSSAQLYVLEISAHFLFLILAGIWIALRFAFIVYRQQFLYIFIATFNLYLGLSAVLVYLIGQVLINYPEMMSINLLVGAIMLVDALLLKRKPYERSLNKN
jgi:hypothetical protein